MQAHAQTQPLFDAPAIPKRMQAIVLPRYGGPEVLHLAEVDTPTPTDDEVLIEVRAASVNAADWHLIRADPWPVRFMTGLGKPSKVPIPGADLAGVVVAVGKDIGRLKVGDEVFGDLSDQRFGAFAQYVCAKETHLVLKPANLGFEAAAAVPMAAVTALTAVRTGGGIQPGQRVLVNGASSGVGSFLVQLARHFGGEVTGMCSSEKVDMVRELGADHVVAYDIEDVTGGDVRFDLIFDAAAYRSIFTYKRILASAGTYVLVGGSGRSIMQVMLAAPLANLFGEQKFRNCLSVPDRNKLERIAELLASGAITPHVDRSFALAEVPDAIRHVESRTVKGKVVVSIG